MIKLSDLASSISGAYTGVEAPITFNKYNLLIPKNQSEIPESTKEKLKDAIIGGLTAGAAAHIIPRYVLKSPFSVPVIIGAAAAGAMTGYSFPRVHNQLVKYRRGEVDKKDVIDLIKKRNAFPENAVANVKNINEDYKNMVGTIKSASFVSSLIRGTGNVAGSVGKAVFTKSPKFSKNPAGWALGTAAKGGAIAGVFGAGSAVTRFSETPRSQSNYTTFLRNNILAGNINPNEIDQKDKEYVNELGMR